MHRAEASSEAYNLVKILQNLVTRFKWNILQRLERAGIGTDNDTNYSTGGTLIWSGSKGLQCQLNHRGPVCFLLLRG